MPIRIPDALPATETLEGENIFVMTEYRALHQDIRPLHVLILNLMPTKIATETQIMRKLSNTPLQIEIELMRTKSHEATHVAASHLETFYRTFDEVFLFLFPTFVADLNALLLPDKQIELKDEAHLNTDLRIVALMSLGFTDANKIAEFLHCSTQSVYNSRRLMYGRLAIPLKEFKERVTTLGRVGERK